ncbi:hypothetical protein ACFQY9_19675 [Microvirga aerilata]|uniref:hypothetical protein n=1 Tax=Microvirga aerilata TaxID=670292 RepID=UPI00362D1E2D
MAAPVLWGSEFTVDLKSTEGVQEETSVIAFADGSFLAVWTDREAGGDIVGQFLAADGTHKGEAFLVTSSPTGDQGAPQAALLSGGRYVVAWSSGGGADEVGVWARIFSPQGQGGNDIYVGNTGVPANPLLSVSALGEGFVVAYAYTESFFNPLHVYAHVFDPSGVAVGSRIKVNGAGARLPSNPMWWRWTMVSMRFSSREKNTQVIGMGTSVVAYSRQPAKRLCLNFGYQLLSQVRSRHPVPPGWPMAVLPLSGSMGMRRRGTTLDIPSGRASSIRRAGRLGRSFRSIS